MAATRTVLVTGASSDIGLAVCRRYLNAGWRVLAHFRTPRPELEAMRGDRLETWQADFSDTAGLEKELRTRSDDFNRADALINLAAVFEPRRFGETSASDIMNSLAANLLPGILLMQSLGPAMQARAFGRVVHVSSIGSVFGGGEQSFCYSLSKHAQEFIPRACRSWAKANVLVNVLRVGVVDTRFHDRAPGKDMTRRVSMIPAGRAATAAEIAEALYWFGSEQNGFTTGQVVSVSGGE